MRLLFRSELIVRGKQQYKNPAVYLLLFRVIISCYEKRKKLKIWFIRVWLIQRIGERQAKRSISCRFMRIVKQMQKVFSNGYKGIVRYKSLVCHPHVNLVATTRSRRPFRSLSAGQGILTFVFFLLSLSFGPCLEVRRCLAAACHSFSCERLSGLSSPSLRR